MVLWILLWRVAIILQYIKQELGQEKVCIAISVHLDTHVIGIVVLWYTYTESQVENKVAFLYSHLHI